jgi:hypothetical protein
VIGAATTAIVSQFLLPSATPYLEMWAYSILGITLTTPTFLVVASAREVAAPDSPQNDPGFYRIFCGYTFFVATKYCVMRELSSTYTEPPRKWPVVPDKPAKAAFWGRGGKDFTLAWMSQDFGTGGILFSSFQQDSDFVGTGWGCGRENDQASRSVLPLFGIAGDLKSIPSIKLEASSHTYTPDTFLGLKSEVMKVMAKVSHQTADDPAPCGLQKL